MRRYARRIDQALRPFLNGLDVLLISLRAYSDRSTRPQLVLSTIEGNREGTADAQLAERARAVLDDLYADELRQLNGADLRRAARLIARWARRHVRSDRHGAR